MSNILPCRPTESRSPSFVSRSPSTKNTSSSVSWVSALTVWSGTAGHVCIPKVLIARVCSACRDSEASINVAIKKINKIFDKRILAKRTLRELKLLRHFNSHENVFDCQVAMSPYSYLLLSVGCRLQPSAYDNHIEYRRYLHPSCSC